MGIQRINVAFLCFSLSSFLGCGAASDSDTDNQDGLELGTEDPNTQRKGVKIIGDSIFAWGNQMIARELSPLIAKPIDSTAVSGHKMWQIKEQYYAIKNPETIKTLILDGGGNDVLGNRNECQYKFTARCKEFVDQAGGMITELLRDSKIKGIPNVLFLQVHNPMGINQGFDQAVEYGNQVTKKACNDSGVRCVLVDPRPAFNGRWEYLDWDGIHPSPQGGKAFAELIAQALKEAGMEP